MNHRKAAGQWAAHGNVRVEEEFLEALSHASHSTVSGGLAKVLRLDFELGVVAIGAAIAVSVVTVIGSEDGVSAVAALVTASAALILVSGLGRAAAAPLRRATDRRYQRLVSFLQAWQLLEAASRGISDEDASIPDRRPLGATLGALQKRGILREDEIEEFRRLVALRNRVVHLREAPSAQELARAEEQAMALLAAIRAHGPVTTASLPPERDLVLDVAHVGGRRSPTDANAAAPVPIADRAIQEVADLGRAVRDGRVSPAALRAHNVTARWAIRAYVGCALVLLVTSICASLNLPSSSWWLGTRHIWLPALVLASTVVAAGAGRLHTLEGRNRQLRELLWRYLGEASDDQLKQLLAPLSKQLVKGVSIAAEVEEQHIGCGVWRLPRFGEPDELVKLWSHRSGHHVPSGVRWRRGKGAVGQCWSHPDTEVVVDTAAFRNLDRSAFESLDPPTRLGLAWDDWRATSRLWSIWARPLKGQELVGFLSVDCDLPDCATGLSRAAEDPIVRELADAIRGVIEEAGDRLNERLATR